LRQEGGAAEEIRRALAQLQAPHEVLGALERLHSLLARQELTDQDVQAIRALVQGIQWTLRE
jgi:tRNA C32,U32 (ribose-2'-O)-methylase TrmJ